MANQFCSLINSGMSLSCLMGSVIGGIATVYLTNTAIISAVTENSSNIVTGITLSTVSGVSKFFKYEILRESAEYTEEIFTDYKTGINFYKPKLTLFLPKRQTLVRNQVALMASSGPIAAIIMENTATARLAGVDIVTNTFTGAIFGGLYLSQGSTSTAGKAATDQNGFTIVLEGVCKDHSREVAGSLLTTTILDTV